MLSIKQTTGIQNLDEGDYFNNVTPIPPLGEQDHIVDGLDRSLTSLRLIQKSSLSEIELMREYRTRLIADVVTGKLDVRQAAARLPEEGELDDLEVVAMDEDDGEDRDAESLGEEEESDGG